MWAINARGFFCRVQYESTNVNEMNEFALYAIIAGEVVNDPKQYCCLQDPLESMIRRFFYDLLNSVRQMSVIRPVFIPCDLFFHRGATYLAVKQSNKRNLC